MELLAIIGFVISVAICGITLIGITSLVDVQWRCGLCGKLNTTGIIKYAFRWCDHQGWFN